jgi:spore photoproduct lyase
MKTKLKKQFLRKCPGTKDHICCNYYTLTAAMGCPFDCTYCFLQSYTGGRDYFTYENLEDMLEELRSKINPAQPIRIGTGEFTDSIAMEAQTGFIEKYVPQILAISPNITLELKTKSAYLDFLPTVGFQKQIVIAWSLNPQSIIDADEKGAASLCERFAAASKAVALGYRVAFHFDPIVFSSDWEEKYKPVVDELKVRFSTATVAWISLGALRFTPKLKPIVEKRFPESTLLYGEFFPGDDGKMRYPEPIRIRLFKQMYEWLSEYPVYLCMESPEVWRAVFGERPENIKNLDTLF